MEVISGISLLVLALVFFSVFSLKAPKGQEAMGGLANAAVATFLVEAILLYIAGDLAGIEFLGEVGATAGAMGGVAAVILVSLNMGANPVFAVTAGVAVGGFGILPGFVAGYVVGHASPIIEKKLPEGIDVIVGALVISSLARGVAVVSDPVVNATLAQIGNTITIAASSSPIVMGFLLGGMMKMICTSPLSSMAVTAMLQLNGLAMGIAAVACVGGSFTNGIIFKKLGLGDKSKVTAVMLEPLTQADIITRNPVPIYVSNFFGGALSGVSAAMFGIVNNAPGTASPIPGLITPFAFNDPMNVVLAMLFAIAGGILAGVVGAAVFKNTKFAPSAQLETIETVTTVEA